MLLLLLLFICNNFNTLAEQDMFIWLYSNKYSTAIIEDFNSNNLKG